jgi:hypothetical protein
MGDYTWYDVGLWVGMHCRTRVWLWPWADGLRATEALPHPGLKSFSPIGRIIRVGGGGPGAPLSPQAAAGRNKRTPSSRFLDLASV